MLEDLKGKRVLVTGASTGIGAAVARGFAAAGARVAVHYHASASEAEAVVAEIGGAGGSALALEADLGGRSGAAELVEEAAARLGGLDVLVNNAGALLRRAPLGEIDDALFDRVLDLNVRSVVMASQAAVPHLKKAGGGSIINTSSVAARNGGGPGSALYGGAKAFVSNVTRNMARELAPQGIRVNAVAPGVIMTPFHERYSSPELLEQMRRSIPMGRIGKAEDCVGAYLFLASPALSGYITGQTIEVNGGQIMP
ncbi:MAG TPA: glucose 1-dehydrogenase [Dongiaceae bacterium]|nr:glucose 1-dehydrogenase [Dongiaceae bacterium]